MATTRTVTATKVKRTGETVPYAFDFADDLPATVTLTSAQATLATVFRGEDVTPSAIISGPGTIVGTKVSQDLTAGVSGVWYCLEFNATRSDGKLIEGQMIIRVSDRCVETVPT